MLEKLLLVAASNDLNFREGFRIDEHFSHFPDNAEEHRHVDNEHLAKCLWVVVLSDAGGKFHEFIDRGGHHTDAASFHVDYYAGLLDEVSTCL